MQILLIVFQYTVKQTDYEYEGNYQLRINVLIANIKENFSPSV